MKASTPPSWSASSSRQSWHWTWKLVWMALYGVSATGDVMMHVPACGGFSVDVLLLEVVNVDVVE